MLKVKFETSFHLKAYYKCSSPLWACVLSILELLKAKVKDSNINWNLLMTIDAH